MDPLLVLEPLLVMKSLKVKPDATLERKTWRHFKDEGTGDSRSNVIYPKSETSDRHPPHCND